MTQFYRTRLAVAVISSGLLGGTLANAQAYPYAYLAAQAADPGAPPEQNPSSPAGSGVQAIVAGSGLLGGAITSAGTISVDVGTGANKILQLNEQGQIPAVDGSLLTNVNGSEIQQLKDDHKKLQERLEQLEQKLQSHSTPK